MVEEMSPSLGNLFRIMQKKSFFLDVNLQWHLKLRIIINYTERAPEGKDTDGNTINEVHVIPS